MVIVEEAVVVVEGDLLRPELDAREDVDRTLEGCGEHPPEGEERQQDRHGECQIDEGLAEAFARGHSILSEVLPHQPHGGRHQDDQEGEHADQHRHGPAILVEQEGRVVGVDGDQLGRRARTALGQDEDLVEGADRIDRAQHHGDEQHGPQQRQRVVEEGLPAAGPVDPGRLERILRHGLQAGEDDEEEQRGPFPDIDHDQGQEGGHRLGQHMGRVQAQGLEQGIDDADVRGVEQPPDDADDHRRDGHRQDQHDADEAGVAQLARDQKRQQQAEQGLEGDDAGRHTSPWSGSPARRPHRCRRRQNCPSPRSPCRARSGTGPGSRGCRPGSGRGRRRRGQEPRAGAEDRVRRPHAAAVPCFRVLRRAWPRRF